MAAETPIEIAPAPLIFATGVGPVHVRDSMVHMVLWAEQIRLTEPGFDRIAVARLVMPLDRIGEKIATVTAAIDAAKDG